MRFGYAVANTGFMGTVGIIVLGHVVTIATAMALAEIATNQKVEGGGEYFIISRSFGLEIGGAIGIALFLSQAISVAFYVIAFGEAAPAVVASVAQPTSVATGLREAVEMAASLAAPGDTVLLAPGCASFDEFESYAARGDRFAELVSAIGASK